MKKKFFLRMFLPALAMVLVLSGCENNQENQQKNNNAEVNQSNNSGGQGDGNAQRNQNNLSEEYQVDPSDMVNSERLIEGMAKEELSEAEKNGLILMREEEKLAHDVYTKLAEKWGQKSFSNIADSEQTHTEAVKALLDKYEIADPVVSNEVGKFTSGEMQKLYDDLVAQGDKSLEEALKVGATVEDLDIKDLQDLLVKNDNEDIKIVYENLMKGSRNHLRAYVRQMERNGNTYSAQYISREHYQEIISGEQERGSVNGAGKRDGNQQQKGNGSGNGSVDGSRDGSGSGTGGGRNQI